MAYDFKTKRVTSRNWSLGLAPLYSMPSKKLPSLAVVKKPPAPPSGLGMVGLHLALAVGAYLGTCFLTRDKKQVVAETKYVGYHPGNGF